MKTTKDLNFTPHLQGCFRAKMNFDNGYGVSVVFGKYFQGIEVAVLFNDKLTDDIYNGLLPADVDELMIEVQSLKSGEIFDSDIPFWCVCDSLIGRASDEKV